MLVMRRRAGESVLIGDDIEIEVLEVSGSRVRLGIKVPDEIAIVRKEVKATREQNLNAARKVNAETISSLLDRLSR